jgi:hypothetical protein
MIYKWKKALERAPNIDFDRKEINGSFEKSICLYITLYFFAHETDLHYLP